MLIHASSIDIPYGVCDAISLFYLLLTSILVDGIQSSSRGSYIEFAMLYLLCRPIQLPNHTVRHILSTKVSDCRSLHKRENS